MPVSAYLRAVALLICAAAALFASAGSFAILSFWLYLAILGVVFIISFAMLDRGLLEERMRPGGRPIPLGLRLLNVVLIIHLIIAGLDRGRMHWSDTVSPWLQAAGFLIIAAGYALVFWASCTRPVYRVGSRGAGSCGIATRSGQTGQPLGDPRGRRIRARPIRGDERALRLHTTSGICRRRLDRPGEWRRAWFVARRRVSCRQRLAVPAVSSNHRRSHTAKAAARLCRLRAAREMAADPRNLVRSGGALHAFVEVET